MTQRDRLAAVLDALWPPDPRLHWRDSRAAADALIAHGVVALAPDERVVSVEGLARALRTEGTSARWKSSELSHTMRWESETFAALLLLALDRDAVWDSPNLAAGMELARKDFEEGRVAPFQHRVPRPDGDKA